MAIFITTGSYSAEAMRGMMAHPSDREAATRKLIESAGGKLIAWYLTTGDSDFMVIAEAPDGAAIIPALLASGASGAVSHLKTVSAFTAAEFMAAQKKAGASAKAYPSPA
jgi:uncharacterized protein with GYD domain